MIKAFLLSFLLIILFFLAGVTNIFAIMTYTITYYVAIVLLIAVLTVAFIVLKRHADKGKKDEEDDK